MTRHSKDLDLFVTPDDCARILAVLRAAGYRTELTFPHWLGKVYSGSECIDVIFNLGKSIATGDGVVCGGSCVPSCWICLCTFAHLNKNLVQ